MGTLLSLVWAIAEPSQWSLLQILQFKQMHQPDTIKQYSHAVYKGVMDGAQGNITGGKTEESRARTKKK
jgi:hypothetical protein